MTIYGQRDHTHVGISDIVLHDKRWWCCFGRLVLGNPHKKRLKYRDIVLTSNKSKQKVHVTRTRPYTFPQSRTGRQERKIEMWRDRPTWQFPESRVRDLKNMATVNIYSVAVNIEQLEFCITLFCYQLSMLISGNFAWFHILVIFSMLIKRDFAIL